MKIYIDADACPVTRIFHSAQAEIHKQSRKLYGKDRGNHTYALWIFLCRAHLFDYADGSEYSVDEAQAHRV